LFEVVLACNWMFIKPFEFIGRWNKEMSVMRHSINRLLFIFATIVFLSPMSAFREKISKDEF